MRIVARWASKGRDYINLSVSQDGVYSYDGSGCGGILPAMADDAAAITYMEKPWGHVGGAGPVTVLASDRTSTKRVSISI